MPAIDQAEMLEVLLASSATWQSETGSASMAAARAFIREYESTGSTYPQAVIQDQDAESRQAGVGQYSGSGRLILAFFFRPDPATYTTPETRRAYVREKVYTIKQEMEALSASFATPTGYSVSHLVVRQFRITDPPYQRDSARESGPPGGRNTWICVFEVEY